MPCRALMWRWEEGEAAFERTLAEDLAALDEKFQATVPNNADLRIDSAAFRSKP